MIFFYHIEHLGHIEHIAMCTYVNYVPYPDAAVWTSVVKKIVNKN